MAKTMGLGAMLFPASVIIVLVGSLVAGVTEMPWFIWVSLTLGILLAIYNVTVKETVTFLVAIAAVPIGLASLKVLPLGDILVSLIENFIALLAPTATVVGLATIYKIIVRR